MQPQHHSIRLRGSFRRCSCSLRALRMNKEPLWLYTVVTHLRSTVRLESIGNLKNRCLLWSSPRCIAPTVLERNLTARSDFRPPFQFDRQRCEHTVATLALRLGVARAVAVRFLFVSLPTKSTCEAQTHIYRQTNYSTTSTQCPHSG